MQSIPKLFPLFLLTICIVRLLSAVVPGLLEYLMEPFDFDIPFGDTDNGPTHIIFSFVFLLCGFLLVLAVSAIIRVLSRQGKWLRAPGAKSLLLIMIASEILIFFHVPARLHFYTRFWELEKAAAQKSSRNESFYFDTISFERRISPSRCTEDYGFAYIPDLSKAKYEVTHLHGKWYIFGGCPNPMISNNENN
jgi:hypothetical protein